MDTQIRENNSSDEENNCQDILEAGAVHISAVAIGNSEKIHLGDEININGPAVIEQYFHKYLNITDEDDTTYQFFGKVEIRNGEFIQHEDGATTPLDIALRVKSRREWNALKPKESKDIELPVPLVIISHTVSQPCTSAVQCSTAVANIQAGHLAVGWPDISYNFLVGGDGNIYIGRGWNKVGNHTLNFNEKSIGIAFIGNFMVELPPQKQIEAAKLLIEEGVKFKKIAPDYKLYFHKQLRPTESPGAALIEEIMKWPHWAIYEP